MGIPSKEDFANIVAALFVCAYLLTAVFGPSETALQLKEWALVCFGYFFSNVSK